MLEETDSTVASLQSTKTQIARFTTANFVFRTVSLSLSIYSDGLWNITFYGIWSLPIIFFYLVIEAIVFFGFSFSCWPVNIVFQVLFILHDFAYVLAIIILQIVNGFEDVDYMDSIFAALLFVNGVIQVTLTVYYSKLPKRSCCVNITDTRSEIYQIQPENIEQVLVRTDTYYLTLIGLL